VAPRYSGAALNARGGTWTNAGLQQNGGRQSQDECPVAQDRVKECSVRCRIRPKRLKKQWSRAGMRRFHSIICIRDMNPLRRPAYSMLLQYQNAKGGFHDREDHDDLSS
jgi:hypothetical protein